MSRALLILAGDAQRARAIKWIAQAPAGTRLEFKAPRRTLEQNALMWVLLTQIAAQKEHCGRKYPAETWKSLFLHAMGREMQFVPALDGHGFLPIGMRSSDLSKQEMAELIEFIQSWAAQNGVVFQEAADHCEGGSGGLACGSRLLRGPDCCDCRCGGA